MGTIVMVFAGEYDLASKERLRAELKPLIELRSVVFDLGEVTYLDSSCIGEFIRLHNARAAKGFGPETVVLRHRTIKKLFDILALQTVFRIVDNLDDAIDSGEAAIVQYAFSTDENSAASGPTPTPTTPLKGTG